MELQVRTIDASEVAEWLAAKDLGFLRAQVEDYEELALHVREAMDLDRTWAALDSGRVVGTLRSFETRLTVPGPAEVTAAALTNVTVSPTHRRRGLLTKMLAGDLTASMERGEPLGILIASEFPIYGRFGYGAAVESATYTVDTLGTRFGTRSSGSVELVDLAVLRKEAPGLYDAYRARQPGAIERDEKRWDRDLHQVAWPGDEPPRGYSALYRAESGEIEGYLRYRAEPKWDDMRRQGQLVVEEMLAVTPAAYHGLWRYLCEVDLVATVRATDRSVDEPLVWLLEDGRAMRQTSRFDFLWVRVLDVCAALSSRRYMVDGGVVIEVEDELGFARGRYVLEGGPQGALCTRTNEPAELALSVGELGSVYLGGVTLRSLAAAGRVEEREPGALARADLMFRSATTPWCSTWF